jgi:glycerol-3-phosphate dehydrogenase (NAD(P)+)
MQSPETVGLFRFAPLRFPAVTPLIGILGGGAFGTALASSFARNGRSVRMWVRDPETVREINELRQNKKYAGEVRLPDGLQATENFQEVVRDSFVLIYALPSPAIREILLQVKQVANGKLPLFVNTAKGLDPEGVRFHHELASEVFGADFVSSRYFCLSGPSFASEMLKLHPTSVTLAGLHEENLRELQILLGSPTFRIYTNRDLVGCQLGGAMKNVVAIAAGLMDGLGYGHNTQAALINRGLGEIRRLGMAMGAKSETFLGLAVLGDLILTCTGDLSRNHNFGVFLGKGYSVDEAKGLVGSTIEGIFGAQAVRKLALKSGVDTPICAEVFHILFDGKPPRQSLEDLLNRPLGDEGL